MTMFEELVHVRTLFGAIDSYLKLMVRIRPQVASTHAEELERFAERWISTGALNRVDGIGKEWLEAYLWSLGNRQSAYEALSEFFGWATREGLVERSPLGISA